MEPAAILLRLCENSYFSHSILLEHSSAPFNVEFHDIFAIFRRFHVVVNKFESCSRSSTGETWSGLTLA